MTAARIDDAFTVVFLVRHGQAAVPDRDGRYFSKAQVPLTDLGERQAREVARLLRAIRVDRIFASDLLRARQTAEIISRAIGVPVQYDAQLREVDSGDLDGSTVEALEEAHPDFLPWIRAGFGQGFASDDDHFDPSLRFPGGERVVDAAERAFAAFRRICRHHPGGCVAIVSHAWVTAAILCRVIGIPTSHYFRFGQANAGVSLVRVGHDGRGMLDGLNLAVPLPLLAGGSVPVRDEATARGGR